MRIHGHREGEEGWPGVTGLPLRPGETEGPSPRVRTPSLAVSGTAYHSSLGRTPLGTPYVLSRNLSPNLLNRASPLAFNAAHSSVGADGPDPFAHGVDVQISNLDYRLSRKELQQLMQEAFSRHGKVSFHCLCCLCSSPCCISRCARLTHHT